MQQLFCACSSLLRFILVCGRPFGIVHCFGNFIQVGVLFLLFIMQFWVCFVGIFYSHIIEQQKA